MEFAYYRQAMGDDSAGKAGLKESWLREASCRFPLFKDWENVYGPSRVSCILWDVPGTRERAKTIATGCGVL